MPPPLPLPQGQYKLEGVPPEAGAAWINIHAKTEIPSSLHIDGNGRAYLRSEVQPGMTLLVQPKAWQGTRVPAPVKLELEKMLGSRSAAGESAGSLPASASAIDYRTTGVVQSRLPATPRADTNDVEFFNSLLASAGKRPESSSVGEEVGFDRILGGAGLKGIDPTPIVLTIGLVIIALAIGAAAFLGSRAK